MCMVQHSSISGVCVSVWWAVACRARDQVGRTALHDAAADNRLEIIQVGEQQQASREVDGREHRAGRQAGGL